MIPIDFQRHLWNFKVTRTEKNTDLTPIWAIPDNNSPLNGRMTMKHYTEILKA